MATKPLIASQYQLTQLAQAIQALVDLTDRWPYQSAESEGWASYRVHPTLDELHHALDLLAGHTELLDVILKVQVQEGSGSARLAAQGLLVETWAEDEALSPPPLEGPALERFRALAALLSHQNQWVSPDLVTGALDHLAQDGALVEVALDLFLDKQELVERLGHPEHVRMLLYSCCDKFVETMTTLSLPDLMRLLVPASERALVILLGDATGLAEGPSLSIIGLDHWVDASGNSLSERVTSLETVETALVFRQDECYWENEEPALTPYHLNVVTGSFSRPEIVQLITGLRDRLAIAYLANRVRAQDDTLACEFWGFHRVSLVLPPLGRDEATGEAFRLMAWAYENASSDKLTLVRQVISLQLREMANQNYDRVMASAGEILDTAKSSFQMVMQRNVALYFDKRLDLSDHLRAFGNDFADTVSALVDGLLSDLFRTAGLVLLVVGMIVLGSGEPSWVPRLAGVLYLIYLAIVMTCLLPTRYWRYRNQVTHYHAHLESLQEILSDGEMEHLQTNLFPRTRRTFLVIFAITLAIYLALALAALVVLLD
jgi:hypothetical protein